MFLGSIERKLPAELRKHLTSDSVSLFEPQRALKWKSYFLAPTKEPKESLCPSVPKCSFFLFLAPIFKQTSRWLQDDFMKTSWRLQYDFSMTSGWLQDGFRMASGWLQDGFRMASGWLQDDFRMTRRESTQKALREYFKSTQRAFREKESIQTSSYRRSLKYFVLFRRNFAEAWKGLLDS